MAGDENKSRCAESGVIPAQFGFGAIDRLRGVVVVIQSEFNFDIVRFRENMQIRPMTVGDVDFGMQLTTEAGWNQSPADWLRLIEMQPHGFFIADWDGRAVGTVGTAVFGSVGWINMVMVRREHRGKGIGTRLFQHALDMLDDRRIACVRLDATPMGRPLYQRFGFHDQFKILRYGGMPRRSKMPLTQVGDLDRSAFAQIVDLDGQVVGTQRSRLLDRFLTEQETSARTIIHDGRVEGYCCARPGSIATQIGPCIARSVQVGRRLLGDALSSRMNQNVILDVPSENTASTATAESSGLSIQRTLMRMYRGAEIRENVEQLFASSGPEKG